MTARAPHNPPKAPEPLPARWRDILRAGLKSDALPSQRRLFEELNPQAMGTPFMEQRRSRPQIPAAILVPIVDRALGPTVVLMVRSSTMPSHPGQISFPGGRVHPEDPTRLATALRETHEEIGVTPSNIEVLGVMGEHFGGQGYRVTPVVGGLAGKTAFIPCEREVETLFEVPLVHLLNLENHKPETQNFNGTAYNMFAVRYQGWRIWGLTAGMIHTLALAWGEGLRVLKDNGAV